MDAAKITEIVVYYLEVLKDLGVEPKRSETGFPEREHTAWMCTQVVLFLKTERFDKANRWLGFVQGVLFKEGIFELSQLKDHNRSRDARPEPGDNPDEFTL